MITKELESVREPTAKASRHYEAPAVLATFTEAQLIEQASDMSAEGWALWSRK